MLFTASGLTDRESEVLGRIEDLRKALSYAVESRRWTGFLRRVMLARAIQSSNSIEGHNVTVDDAVAAVDGESPMDATAEDWAATVGYRNAMTYVLQLADDPHFQHTESLIRSLHFMVLAHNLTKNPGRWRPGPIFVRREPSGERVYEGPDAELVPGLMAELVAGLNAANEHHSLICAAMSHLNLVMIHPFSDGNGRMGRIIQSTVLARGGILSPHFCSIEEWLGRHTEEYYQVLGEVGQGAWHPENKPTAWVRLCLKAHFQQALTLLRRTRELSKLWESLEHEIRPHGWPDRVLVALANAALGFRVRNSTYRVQEDLTMGNAAYDLKLLTDAGFLVAAGQGRGRYYVASERLLNLRVAIREPKAVVEDPFDTKVTLSGIESELALSPPKPVEPVEPVQGSLEVFWEGDT